MCRLLAEAPASWSYTPFWNPLPVWDYWYVLLIPLCVGVSIAYKAVKCHEVKQVPRESAMIFISIIVGIALAGALLMGIVKWMERG